MHKAKALVMAAVLFGSLALGTLIAFTPSARAVDNPCDPTYGMLKLCKANHGRWDNSCCCCVQH